MAANINKVVRSHCRAAGVWAAAAGFLFAARVVGEVTSGGVLLDSGRAAVVSLVVGIMGNAWLASFILSYSTLLSRRSVPAGLARFVFYIWQVGVAGLCLVQFREFFGVTRLGAFPGPLFFTGLVTTGIALRILQGHLTKPTPVHWAHLVASVGLSLSTLMIDLSYFVGGGLITRLGSLFFVTAWIGGGSIGLFATGVGLESYEDQKVILIALGGQGAIFAGMLMGPVGGFIAMIGSLAFLFSLGSLLQKRWHGRFDRWSERLLMAGLVLAFLTGFGQAMAVESVLFVFGWSYFRALDAFPVLRPELLLIPLLWSGGALLQITSREPPDALGRLILWPAAIGIAAPTGLMRALFFVPDLRYQSLLVRALFAAGELLCAWGCLALGAHLRPKRGRAKLRSVEDEG